MPSDESKGSQLDAIGSLAQRQLDNTVSKAHAESVVEPDGVADDFRWKSIAVVAWRIGLHWTILSVTSSI